MPTLCIDARMWGIGHTGIGRYVENLIDHLPADPRIKVVLILHPSHLDEPKLARFIRYGARFHPYSFLSQIEMLVLLLKIRPHLTHFTHFSLPLLWPGRFIVTIHDLIKHFSTGPATTTRHPLLYLAKYLGYQLVMGVAVYRSAAILVPSRYWQIQLAKRYAVSPKKIHVTYEGVTGHFRPARSGRPRTSVPQPYLIYTGNLYPHKNIPVLISALGIVNRRLAKPLYLVIVCARSVFESRLPTSPFVLFLGRVPDEELVRLYQHAAAFVFPSLIEGFGLPGLEAMAAGLPVIAANSTSLPEVYGSAALYFDPASPPDLADKIVMVLSDHHLRRQLISSGLAQVKKYSWVKMANQTWEIYQTMLHLSTTG